MTEDRLTISGLGVTARGTRRDEHPTVLTDIALAFTVWAVPGVVHAEDGDEHTASFEIRKD